MLSYGQLNHGTTCPRALAPGPDRLWLVFNDSDTGESTKIIKYPGQETVQIRPKVVYCSVTILDISFPWLDLLLQTPVESFFAEPAAGLLFLAPIHIPETLHTWTNLMPVGSEGLNASHDQHVG